MKVFVISVGRDRSGFFAPAAEDYLARIARWAKVQAVELKASPASGAKARSEEALAILRATPPKTELVVLDEAGTGMSTEAFAQWLGGQRDKGRDVAFAIGGDDGLAPSLCDHAAWKLSLSPMTLPHRLARVVLAEQLYRAFSILHGTPYHRA